MSDNPAKYEVLIKQYLRSILDMCEMDGEIIIALLLPWRWKERMNQSSWIEKGPQSVSFKLTSSDVRIVR